MRNWQNCNGVDTSRVQFGVLEYTVIMAVYLPLIFRCIFFSRMESMDSAGPSSSSSFAGGDAAGPASSVGGVLAGREGAAAVLAGLLSARALFGGEG